MLVVGRYPRKQERCTYRYVIDAIPLKRQHPDASGPFPWPKSPDSLAGLTLAEAFPEVVLLDPLSERLSQYMSLVSMRQQLVASNIANADTPGYKAKDIDFDNEFEDVVSGLQPMVGEVRGLTLKNDGNNVDLDREARLLAENAMRFSIAGNMLRGQLKELKMAIEGGGSSS